MNKKMRELFTKMEQKRLMAKGFMEGENKDVAKANELLDEVEAIQKEFDVEKRLYEAEKAEDSGAEEQKSHKDEEKADGFKVIAKQMRKAPLNEKEKALIVGGVDGENYLLPEDVRFEIKELRKQYKSAKDLVTVIPTSALTGGTNYEAGDVLGLTELVDGEAVDTTNQPKFTRKTWAIKFFSKLIPVSNILAGAEKAGLLGYINKWFIKNAIYTENNAIFTALKTGKTVKNLVGWEALKTSLNKDLDPAALLDAVIVTNQTGFDVLDNEKDANGRPILQPNPADATKMMFKGLPIEVFADAQLPNVSGKAPIFYGSLKAGAEFEEYENLQFATSGDYLFGANQLAVRVIEGFDVIQTDTASYVYGTISPTA